MREISRVGAFLVADHDECANTTPRAASVVLFSCCWHGCWGVSPPTPYSIFHLSMVHGAEMVAIMVAFFALLFAY